MARSGLLGLDIAEQKKSFRDRTKDVLFGEAYDF